MDDRCSASVRAWEARHTRLRGDGSGRVDVWLLAMDVNEGTQSRGRASPFGAGAQDDVCGASESWKARMERETDGMWLMTW